MKNLEMIDYLINIVYILPNYQQVYGMDFNTLAFHIGKNIKTSRKKLGLSQSQACLKMACDKRFYQRIEAGKAGLTLRTLLKISQALDIPFPELFKIEEVADPSSNEQL